MKKALGRGLSTLIPDDTEEILQIEIDKIITNPNQPRKFFDEKSLSNLAASISEKGIIQPIIVSRTENGEFLLIAGERRLKASLSAGLEKIPCIVRDNEKDDALEISLIENIQRENLNPIETACAFQQLIETYHLTQEDLSAKVGKDRATIANYLRLINLADEIKNMLINGSLTMGHAKAILSIEDKETQINMAKKVIENDISVRETEKLCKLQTIQNKPKKEKINDPHIEDLEQELTTTLGTRVKITTQGKKGKIEIQYYNIDELNRLIDILRV
ncbi:stage 0 sporulation protein J [Candidatus Magnetoovum chiemensis]|nr:stage 0 sporulation protein J [Candidatus Magnetoovum chiemensis]